MKQETPDAGWLESHDNPVTDVVRRVRDTIKDAIKGDARSENKPAAKKKGASRKKARRPAAKKARARRKTARPAAKKTARKKKSSRTSARSPKKSRKRAARK